MKKLLLALALLAVLLTACGPSNFECDMALEQYNDGAPLEGMEVQMILNNNWAPDTVGDRLQACIEGGWEGYR